MNEIAASLSTIKTFRITVFVFACLLGGFAIWNLATEVLRPAHIEFAATAEFAESTSSQRDAATMAAKVGLFRGDLWADAAFAYGDQLWNEDYLSKADPAEIERTRSLTEQAITYAPYNSRLWLLRALTYSRLDWLNDKASASLKMSYYTGSNTIELIPERLLLATRSRALDDDEFQELVRHDIRIAVIRKSEMKPSIVAAFNNASLSGREFIEKTLAKFDPSMLPLIRSEGPHR